MYTQQQHYDIVISSIGDRSNTQQLQMGQQTHTHNKWTCDVCRIAVFDTYDEAIQHEVSCTGAPPSAPPPSQQPRPQQQIGRTKQDNLSSKSSKEEVNVLLPNHRASSSISPSIGIKNGKCKVLSSSKNINNNVRKNRSSRNQDQGSTTSNNHHGEMLINGGGTFTNNSNSLFNYNLSSVVSNKQEKNENYYFCAAFVITLIRILIEYISSLTRRIRRNRNNKVQIILLL